MTKFYIRQTFILLFVFLCCCGCENDTHPPETITYKTDEHTWQSKSSIQLLGDYSYQATEVPLQYYISKQKGAENKREIDSIFEAHKKERVIEMQFSHITGQDLLKPELNTQDTYTTAVEYLAFNIRDDFEVITSSNDTITCTGVHFERNFNVAPYKKILLYFNEIPPEDNIQLVYQDHLFGKGTIKFKLEEKPIKL